MILGQRNAFLTPPMSLQYFHYDVMIYLHVVARKTIVPPPTYECTTMARLYFLLSLGVLVVVIAAQNPEQCHMYYGGLVFPEGSRRPVEHGLHWSKTQSRVGVTEVIPVRTGF